MKSKLNEPISCYFKSNGCLIATSHRADKRGYGRIKRDGKYWSLHRWIFYINNGFLPKVVMHVCDNPSCINPIHLLGGNSKENSRDMVKKNRQAFGERNGGGKKLKEYQIKEIRKLLDKTSLQKIANKYNVSKKLILLIKQGKRWKNV